MPESPVALFRANVSECYAAAERAKESTIKQAYLDLAQGWRVLADVFEHLQLQAPLARRYRPRAGPRRGVYELHTMPNDEARNLRHDSPQLSPHTLADGQPNELPEEVAAGPRAAARRDSGFFRP